MTDREQNWETLGMLKRCIKHYTEARKKIYDKEVDLIVKNEEFELNLYDILSENEHKAIVEIIDSLILAEITRNELSAYKIEQRLKNS